MTASAAAARMADATVDGPEWWATPAVALAVIVAGGLVEGSALGRAQGSHLRRRLPGLTLARFFLATLLVAGLGWAVASAPAVLPSGSGGSQPLDDRVLPSLLASRWGRRGESRCPVRCWST